MQQILMLRVAAHLENSTLQLVNGVFCVINANKMVDALNFLRKRGIAALVLGLSTDEEGQNHAKETQKVFMREWIALWEERGLYH